jgi:hypothetical protein
VEDLKLVGYTYSDFDGDRKGDCVAKEDTRGFAGEIGECYSTFD